MGAFLSKKDPDNSDCGKTINITLTSKNFDKYYKELTDCKMRRVSYANNLYKIIKNDGGFDFIYTKPLNTTNQFLIHPRQKITNDKENKFPHPSHVSRDGNWLKVIYTNNSTGELDNKVINVESINAILHNLADTITGGKKRKSKKKKSKKSQKKKSAKGGAKKKKSKKSARSKKR